MRNTAYNDLPVPEDKDEYPPIMDDYFDRNDALLWSLRVRMSMIVIPPAGLSWNGTQLTWTDDWRFPIALFGRMLRGRFGPDGSTRVANLVNGNFLVIDLPYGINDGDSVDFQVVSQITKLQPEKTVIASVVDGQFYLNQTMGL